jgi:methyl-accepting chemotaxis protein
MLDRVTINAVLKTVIAILAGVVVIIMAHGAWNSWTRLVAVNRTAAVADASAYMFTALHNLRSDRSRSYRALLADQRLDPKDPAFLLARDAEMPALKSALVALDTVDFPERQAAVAELGQRIKKLAALHDESAAAVARPKAERRAGLAVELRDEISALIEMLDQLSLRLNKLVAFDDAFVDRLMELKQLAWLVRDTGGDASVMVSSALSGQPIPADVFTKYAGLVSRYETAWTVLEQQAAGAALPPQFADAIAKAKREFFGSDYVDLRTNTLKKLVAGQPPGITTAQWSALTVPKLSTSLAVAEAALDAAKEHAAGQRASATRALGVQLGMLLAAVLLAGAMMLLVSRRVTGPLGQMQGAMMKLAGGDFGVVVPGLERKDEIGAMANAVERFKVLADEKARHEAEEATRRQQGEAAIQAKAAEERAKAADEQAQAFRALGAGLDKLATGDLTFRLSDGFTEDYKGIRDDFNNTIARLQETIGAIALSTREVASTATEISSSTTDLSQRTEEQAASLEETSASMEQISTTVKKNAENAHQANSFAAGTREVADRGGAVVAQAVSAMARIEDSSRKISDIISVIDEIARQTNLLALNAAVEAARAGEAGRGFAVVASEVRSLAQRSSQAAKDIKDLITNSSNQVQEGVELVNRAGSSLTEIVESIKKVAAIVSEIASASGEQSTGCDQVNAALNQMDQVTQQNSALVEQNAAAAKALEQQSHAMDERVSFFRLEQSRPAGNGASQPARHHAVAAAKHRAPAPKPKNGQAGRASRADEPGSGRVSPARSRASSDALCARTSEELPRWPLASLASAAPPLATAMGDDPEWDLLEPAQAVG